VDDLVTGLIAMMEQNDFVGPVNMGNPAEYSIIDLARMIKELSGSSSEIVFLPLPEDDPVRRRPDITLARAKLGWDPKVPIREGLVHTIEYFRETIGVWKPA
jgi:nucleoside-diphosphate-sugar epimerase